MKTLLFLLAFFFCSVSFAQNKNGYGGISAAYMPVKNDLGFLACQVTVGRDCGRLFLEYNQIVTITWETAIPSFFQLRGGLLFHPSHDLYVKPFVGYSLTSAPKNENHNVGQGICAGCYIVQNIPHSDVAIKYELSVNNGYKIVPSIGLLSKF